MNEVIAEDDANWPITLNYRLHGNTDADAEIKIYPGINTLLGPNGSGKTKALRALKEYLRQSNFINQSGRKVHFLSAGRSSPFEAFKSFETNPSWMNTEDAYIGQANYLNQWWDYESVTGDLIVLDRRPDLKLKVEARLQQLFDRSVHLQWTQSGMTIQFASATGATRYASQHEASGILQLVALLSAIHNDHIGALIIDEPEISLHPQYQAFLLEEMELVAGDPNNPQKKLIILASHSPSMLPLRNIRELPSLSFFSSANKKPIQIISTDPILRRDKLIALISRLSMTHRNAMFADHVMLVEGPSDEIITSHVARKLGVRLHARNTQILPVTGKGEFIEAAKLFRLTGKKVSIIADLDALSDNNNIVTYFSSLDEATPVAAAIGRARLTDLDRELRNALSDFIGRHNEQVELSAQNYLDWSSNDSKAFSKVRVTLARVLSDPRSFGGQAGDDAEVLCTRYNVLLSSLKELGCFFLRRGAVENYYDIGDDANAAKPDRAAVEASKFDTQDAGVISDRYSDFRDALLHAAPQQTIDEDVLLRMKLGAILTPVLLTMDAQTSDDRLNEIARSTIGNDAEVFKLSNASSPQTNRINVEFASLLFERDTFPFSISVDDNPNVVVPAKLPGGGAQG